VNIVKAIRQAAGELDVSEAAPVVAAATIDASTAGHPAAGQGVER
jgi:hypothetical protein